MLRLIVSSGLCAALLAVGSTAAAQGRRPSAAPPQPGAQRSVPTQVENRRQPADTSGQSQARRAEAEARRQAAAANNKSAEARAAHPPNEHAADEASAAEQNADGRAARSARRDERRENRRTARE
jgi:hypothetical protein